MHYMTNYKLANEFREVTAMTADEKARIGRMRSESRSYAQIALSLNISQNTIKSFCRRNKLTIGGIAASPQTKSEPEVNTVCKHCGKDLKQKPKQKARSFCSDACRYAWWKAHHEQLDKKAVYYFTCVGCGKEFDSYGNRSRKYCSHGCYIKYRFGDKEARDDL
jgi:DNA-binding CsgD family transcriptional regulator/endogenous inhibitor of DNA gyrase (YacG/DUF329 family)